MHFGDHNNTYHSCYKYVTKEDRTPEHFSRDLELSADTPLFATSDAPIVLIKGGSIDRANTEMIQERIA